MQKASFSELIQGNTPVLVDFYADWCGPCKMMAPILREIAAEYQGRLKVIKVDIDRNPEAAKSYRIQGVPTLILFKNGQIRWQQAGLMSAHQLRAVINQFLN
ncbi:MAG: thioredoxin [Cyclobacteriaceae bacterium]|nr:thioredoxin [Cyclobacteriaceae bacterium]MDW8330682.1 thioredoxin [Cyclobacteriaceae bacterium]